MHLHRHPLLHRLAGGLRAGMGALCIGILSLAGSEVCRAQVQGGGAAIPNGAPVTFQQIAAAPLQASHESNRVRRFLDPAGQLVQVREQLTVQADGTADAAFKLDFVDVVAPTGNTSSARTQWSEVYRANAGLLHMHGGFRIADAQLAQQNYQIFDFGSCRRLGRDVRRVVIYPNRQDKGAWMVDLDVQTGVILYSAEYDAQLRLINELETTSFVVTGYVVELGPRSRAKPAWSWRPKMQVSKYANLGVATAQLGSMTPIQPAIQSVVSDYRQSLVQVTEDPVNGDRTLVLGYSDGIDEFFVLQTKGGGNPFSEHPAVRNVNATSAHAIASYDDASMRAYVFHESGTTYWVVGSGSLARLKDVSFRICQQAVTGN
ncbi:MAG: hypothetical protein RLZZ562_249 [Planctomycetota bacterium]|jgi:hypothetical protein